MSKKLISVVLGVAVLAGTWLVWQWFFCRFYVPPDHLAVVTAKTGDSLPPGQILAHAGQKGVQEDVLGEGRHFLNPFLYDHTVVPVTVIGAGKIGVVTSKVGDDLPAGEFLAEPGQKGIWRKVLGPGKYRMNPVGYRIDIVDAVSIPIGYVGVLTSLSGSQSPEGEFAAAGQKGVRRDVLQPGLYHINPREFSVTVLEIGVNQVSLLGKRGTEVITKGQIATQNRALDELQRSLLMEQQEKRADYLQAARTGAAPGAAKKPGEAPVAPAKPLTTEESISTFVLNQFVEFPSRDGFEISLDMTVEFELPPQHIAWIYKSYGDLPAAVDKIIMPQILSVSRLKGSAYGARDFIIGEGREKFQSDLTDALAKTLAERRIIAHSALIRHVNVPMQILEPIQQASIAQEQDLTNREKQNTARKLAELNTETSLIEQRREQVAQETEKLKAEIVADQEKQVAEIKGETLKLVALIEKETAAVQAEKLTRLGRADAERIRRVEGEKSRGFQLRTAAFGDPDSYNLWTLANGLSDQLKVNILHAGPGTLWTDLEKARLGDLGAAEVLSTKAAKDR